MPKMALHHQTTSISIGSKRHLSTVFHRGTKLPFEDDVPRTTNVLNAKFIENRYGSVQMGQAPSLSMSCTYRDRDTGPDHVSRSGWPRQRKFEPNIV